MTYIPFIGPHNFQISLGARGKKRRTMPTRCDETRLVARWHGGTGSRLWDSSARRRKVARAKMRSSESCDLSSLTFKKDLPFGKLT